MSKQTTKLNAVENAQKTLHELEAKRDAVTASRQNDERELEAVAFAAHTGDQKASAKLETLRDRAIRRDLELKSVDAAIAVAKQNVEVAKAAEAAADQRRVALEIQRLAKELREAGKLADEGLAMFLDATNVMQHIVSQFSTLGL